ncbi:unnamed protein product [Calypogeia fissa]
MPFVTRKERKASAPGARAKVRTPEAALYRYLLPSERLRDEGPSAKRLRAVPCRPRPGSVERPFPTVVPSLDPLRNTRGTPVPGPGAEVQARVQSLQRRMEQALIGKATVVLCLQ